MINKEILKEENIMLPIVYEKGSCEEAIYKTLKDFEDLLIKYSIDDHLLSMVNTFRKNLEKMYEEYYLGHQNKAYKKALTEQLKEMQIVTSILPKESLYRARRNIGNNDYKNDEMFHIKYDLRGKVQTQRFSFPGLPCLYLGASSYVCWLELNRPSFEQFQVATIRQKDESKEFTVIDLCIHPLTYYNELEAKFDTKLNMADYLRWWPIMAACSIAVKNEDDSFKPEYIFPQFMLQYLLEEAIDDNCIGIKYISIKAGKVSKKQYESDYRTYTNYVIPIKTARKTTNSFCEFLEREFGIVRNYSGKELQILTDSIRTSGIKWREIEDEEIHPLDNARLYGTNDVASLYSKSIFRRIENILENENMEQYNDYGELIITPITNEEINQMFE